MDERTRPSTPPPPYGSHQQTREEEEADRLEKYWETLRPDDWDNGFKSGINIFFETNGHFLDRLFGLEAEPAWRAELIVLAANVPGLMSRGFHWSLDNFDPSSSIRFHDGEPKWAGYCNTRVWKHVRIYHLREAGENPTWKATLKVYAKSKSTVINFDRRWITKDTICLVAATNWDRRLVYLVNRANPTYNFNFLFGDMPLEGWWGWPNPEAPSPEPPSPSPEPSSAALVPYNRDLPWLHRLFRFLFSHQWLMLMGGTRVSVKETGSSAMLTASGSVNVPKVSGEDDKTKSRLV